MTVRAVIQDISMIYVYRTEQKTWKHPDNIDLYCLSYQVSGHYDHKFPAQFLPVKADTLFFIPKCTPYSVKCVEQGESICVTFAAEADLAACIFDCRDHPEIKTLFQKLLRYKNLQSPQNYCEAMAILYKLLSFIFRKQASPYVARSRQALLQSACDYMNENYADPTLKVGDLARRCDMSPKYFRTVFRRLYNTSPSRYLIDRRLQTAAKLLTESNLRIGEIAAQTGFADVYYFSKLFKSRFACAPGEYRKRQKTGG